MTTMLYRSGILPQHTILERLSYTPLSRVLLLSPHPHPPPPPTTYNSQHRHLHRRRHNGNNSSTHSPSALEIHTYPLTDIEKQLLESPENQETGGTQRQDITDMQNGCLSDSVNGSSLVYISNPIYGDGSGTPFETPGSSPSRLETEDSSDDERKKYRQRWWLRCR
ncbi:hypothetical protein L1987_31072 [Smallanthus sonchifolius]|uniref:Uncharacterized protein n=1 Tax=Smallanthus sonchifolius TaxID=185202 RepID=A0ACB9I6D3_9ASTR|nr:hypothetical protein L1987_31072 [Smallanthus sonchifolius]